MKLLHILIRLISDLHLGSSDEIVQLKKDTLDWEEQALTKKEPNKIEQLYNKIHEGPFLRLSSFFIYIFLRRWTNEMLNEKPDRGNYIEEDLD